MAKKIVLDMNVVYKAVIKDLQKELLVEDVLLRAMTSLNPLEQKAADSLQHCRVVASHIPSIHPGEEMKVGDEWIRYQEMNVTEDDQSLCMDHLWDKFFTKKDNCEDQFEVLPKVVKCVLALCHSNADVERSLSINRRMLRKQNVSMKGETIIGLESNESSSARLLWCTKCTNYPGNDQGCQKV